MRKSSSKHSKHAERKTRTNHIQEVNEFCKNEHSHVISSPTNSWIVACPREPLIPLVFTNLAKLITSLTFNVTAQVLLLQNFPKVESYLFFFFLPRALEYGFFCHTFMHCFIPLIAIPIMLIDLAPLTSCHVL